PMVTEACRRGSDPHPPGPAGLPVAPRAPLTCGRRAAACCTCSVTARSAGPSPSPAAMPALHIPARPPPLPPHTRSPPLLSANRIAPSGAAGGGSGAMLGRSRLSWRPQGDGGARPGLPRLSLFLGSVTNPDHSVPGVTGARAATQPTRLLQSRTPSTPTSKN
uniref:Uncharacterized protein n=1 Tax=Cyanoderma ruficeps TaxID=181631 RepID=A0A8C3RGT9_9PASS